MNTLETSCFTSTESTCFTSTSNGISGVAVWKPEPAEQTHSSVQVTSSSASQQDSAVHKFDPRVAAECGIAAAVVYQHIRWHCLRSNTGSIQRTIAGICEQYSYIGRKQVRLAIKSLIQSKWIKRVDAIQGYDCVYALKKESNNFSEEGLYLFETEKARRYGIIPAIAYWNIRYFILHNWEKFAKEVQKEINAPNFGIENYEYVIKQSLKAARPEAKCRTSIEKWVSFHPFISVRSARRAFARLLKAELLTKRVGKDRVSVWFLEEPELDAFSSTLINDYAEFKIETAKKTTVRPKRPGTGHEDHNSFVSNCSDSNLRRTLEDTLEKSLKEYEDGSGQNPTLASARVKSGRRPSPGACAPNSPPAPKIIKPINKEKQIRSLTVNTAQKLRMLKVIPSELEKKEMKKEAISTKNKSIKAKNEKVIEEAIKSGKEVRGLREEITDYPMTKRSYNKQYTPYDDEFLFALESLPIEKREAYLQAGMDKLRAQTVS